MGQYDIPAVIEHILRITGREKLIYIGHSMGTRQQFVAETVDSPYFLRSRDHYVLGRHGNASRAQRKD